MANEFDWVIDNEEAFQRGLDRLAQATSDFRIPLRLIASDFYRSQRKLFTLKSAGLYAPLGGFNYNSPAGNGTQTKQQRAQKEKETRTGHSWAPLLYGETGDLRDSTLSRSHKYSIFGLSRKSLEIGTSVPYGKYHQGDGSRKQLPQRKFVFIDGGPADRSSDSNLNGRRQRWLNIMNDHVLQLITGEIL